MNRIVYVNGAFLPEAQAKISIFDRGFLFADGVYEVSSVLGGRLIDNEAHLARLQRSLIELAIPAPANAETITSIQESLVEQNALHEGVVYLQITRGPAERDFKYPDNPNPSLVMFTQNRPIIDVPAAREGVSVISVPDLRWRRRDIKTIGLLPASMAKQAAILAGADDAWLVEDGYVTEGSSNNTFIVDQQGNLITRMLGQDILPGITRAAVLALGQEQHISVIERPFTIAEALEAREAFSTSASSLVYPVVKIDGAPVGDGGPGPIATRLRELYLKLALHDD